NSINFRTIPFCTASAVRHDFARAPCDGDRGSNVVSATKDSGPKIKPKVGSFGGIEPMPTSVAAGTVLRNGVLCGARTFFVVPGGVLDSRCDERAQKSVTPWILDTCSHMWNSAASPSKSSDCLPTRLFCLPILRQATCKRAPRSGRQN